MKKATHINRNEKANKLKQEESKVPPPLYSYQIEQQQMQQKPARVGSSHPNTQMEVVEEELGDTASQRDPQSRGDLHHQTKPSKNTQQTPQYEEQKSHQKQPTAKKVGFLFYDLFSFLNRGIVGR